MPQVLNSSALVEVLSTRVERACRLKNFPTPGKFAVQLIFGKLCSISYFIQLLIHPSICRYYFKLFISPGLPLWSWSRTGQTWRESSIWTKSWRGEKWHRSKSIDKKKHIFVEVWLFFCYISFHFWFPLFELFLPRFGTPAWWLTVESTFSHKRASPVLFRWDPKFA